jgi:hypothetical protein
MIDIKKTKIEFEKRFGITSYARQEMWNWMEGKLVEAASSVNVDQRVSPIFTEEENRILTLLLASKIAEIQVHIVYDEPLEQRMGKVKLINVLNDIHKKISK